MPKAEVLERNPSKFEKEEDMSNLSILNRYCTDLVELMIGKKYKVILLKVSFGIFRTILVSKEEKSLTMKS